ncbi:SAM-dependent methyltransferase [Micromonospora sp. NPDC093277]|uniref:SAM-dependent methyltransferase n=1 Tax=Micromonospora sp. NPDC093277 TaxID=3364291 RepID=UPI0037F657EE
MVKPAGKDSAIYDGLDTSVPHPARRYNYWLGGKDNFAADRAAGDEMVKLFPTVRLAALENRAFLRRAATFLARDAGIRQFLDIGTGLPTANNTHEVAQSVAPESRIVYVDNDPMVMVHARALLTSAPEGRTAYLEADLREPDKILGHPDLLATLDLSQPVALMLIAVLHFIDGEEQTAALVRRLVEALPSGSYVAASHGTMDLADARARAGYEQMRAAGRADIVPRTREEFTALFDGLELVDPGVCAVSEWRAEDEPQPRPAPHEVANYGLVARIP